MWFGVGIIFAIFFIFFDYKNFEKIWPILYIVSIILLILVLFTNRNNGSTSWFKIGSISFQPSEFSKISTILSVSALVNYYAEKKSLNKIYAIFLNIILSAIPIILIIIQPDFGTALVITLSITAILFIGGISYKYIIFGIIFIAILLPISYNYLLPYHAKSRIDTFLNPDLDPTGASYNITRSKLAVGSGGLLGQGFLNGTQTQMGMLPMKSTDFIFPVISEEFGFLMSSFIIILYIIFLFRILLVAKNCRNNFGTLICTGIFMTFFVHVVENIGMSMGLLPITGIPLPFISYGGSSLLTSMIMVGIVESINVRKKKHLL